MVRASTNSTADAKKTETRRPRSAAVTRRSLWGGHDALVLDLAGDPLGDLGPGEPLREVQREVDPRRHAAGGHDVAVVGEPGLHDLGARSPQVLDRQMVGR